MDAAEDPIPEVWSEDPADLAALRASLQRLRDLRPDRVLPAHGQTIGPDLLDRNIAYFDAMAARMETTGGYGSAGWPGSGPGLGLEELVPGLRPMPPDALRFYRGCHARNLAAARRSLHEER